MKLFIDTSNWALHLVLLDHNNQLIDSITLLDCKKVSDIALLKISTLLNKHQLVLKDISAFYVTTGPGSYTGVRVGLTIVKTIKTTNAAVKVYLINSLLFQAGIKNAISLLDARSNQWYCGVYAQGVLLAPISLIHDAQLPSIFAQYPQFICLKNNQHLDAAQQFIKLLNHFTLEEHLSNLRPLYVKNFI